MNLSWPYRRIATEEAFSVPEVYQALRDWAATADPAEPDQDFWDFVFTQDTPGCGGSGGSCSTWTGSGWRSCRMPNGSSASRPVPR